MRAIVVNTASGAVSEYEDFYFDSVTQGHIGGKPGLFAVGGTTDDGQLIVAHAITPPLLQQNLQKKRLAAVYVAAKAEGDMQIHVHGQSMQWQYPLHIRAGGMSRATPGRGICESYLAVGISNPQGQAFEIDSIAAEVVLSQRHI